MKKKLLFSAIACTVSVATQAHIFISEIIEGSSYNKAIEIANSGDSAVTLTGYSIARNTSGGSTWDAVYASGSLDLSAYTIAAGETLVLANSHADDEILALADLATNNSALTFNGDDPVALFIDGLTYDVAGEMGGVDWNKNVTLLRTYNQTPTSTYDSSDWKKSDQDDWYHLGIISELSEKDDEETTAPEYDAQVTIMALQGDAESSPYVDSENDQYSLDETFKVTGIVTHIQTSALGSDLAVGFFMQDANGDDNALTSDGIFVYYDDVADLALSVGDEVNVYGPVSEYYNCTQLSAEFVEATGETDNIEVTVLSTLASDETFEDTLERYEGMFIELDETSEMKITRTFGYDYDAYRNNMVVAQGDINYHPNQFYGPTSDGANTQSSNNALNRLFIESATEAQDGVVPWYSDFASDDGTGSSSDYLRIGATVNGMQGFLGYSYSEFRLYVDNQLSAENFLHDGVDRTAAPEVKAGDLKIATFNVLNYFNSEIDGAENPYGSNRGADNTTDLTKQTAKIVSALVAMDADFVGLMEVENNGFTDDSAIVALVTALNEQLDEIDQYSIAYSSDYDYIGTDAITNQAIYRASKLSLDSFSVIEMPQQHAPAVSYGSSSTESGDNYMRNAVTPTFTVIGTDKKLTISVNHLKSKGSTCYEDVVTGEELDDDLQGSCENLRVSGGYQLAESLANVEGYTLIVGDLNAYGNEDAIMLLTNQENAASDYELKAAAYTYIGGDDQALGEVLHGENGAILNDSYGYIDILSQFEEKGLSYSYNDEVGTLDYILVDSELNKRVVDATHWNINASESDLFQYDYDYGDVTIYDDAYRSSDHDPALMVLNIQDDPVLGKYVRVSTKISYMPKQPTNITAKGHFTVLVNLSRLHVLQVGSKVSVVVSTADESGAISSRTKSINLTAKQIRQGWVSLEVGDVSEAQVTVYRYVNGALLKQSDYTLRKENRYQHKAHTKHTQKEAHKIVKTYR